MAFRVAEGYVEVTMDRKKYDAEKAKLGRDSLDLKVLVKLDQTAAKAQLQKLLLGNELKVTIKPEMGEAGPYLTKLDRLTRDQKITITPVMGNPDNYLRQLDRLTRDQHVSVNPRFKNTDVYLRQLDRLTRDQHIDVRTNLVTGDLRPRLDNLTRNRRIRVDVDAQGVSALSNAFRGLGGSGGGASEGMSRLTARILAYTGAALTAAPTTASLAQAIIAMGPAAAVAAPAIASLASIVGALKVGLGGVGGAFKAAFAPAAGGGGGGGADGMAKQIQAAERRVADAKRGVVQATEDAARRVQRANRDVGDAEQALADAREQAADRSTRALQDVADAERNLADAQARSLRAQQDLEAARAQAVEDLEDLANRVAAGKLQERSDILRLQEAEADLAVVRRAGSGATADQVARAELAYDQAVQALQEQRLENRRLQAQQEQAARAGVDGSEAVRSAQEQVTEATRDSEDAARDLAGAQQDAAQSQKENARALADAQRDLADAQQAATDAVVEGNDRVARSQEELARAQEDLAAASEKQAAAGAAAADKFAEAMARLAPAAREFVQAIIALKPAWDALRLDVQQQLFEGIGARLTTVAQQVLPDLRAGLVGTAGVLNQMGLNALDAIDKLSKAGTLKAAFASVNDGLKPLQKAPADFLSIFTTLTAAAGPAFQKIAAAAGEALGSFSAKLTAGLATGELTKKISDALAVAVKFGGLLFDVFGVVGNVMRAASAAGGDSLSILGEVFKYLKQITGSPEVQNGLKALFGVFNSIAATALPLLGQALLALMPVFQALQPPIQVLLQSLGDALRPVIAALGPVLVAAAEAVGQLIIAASPLLVLAGELIAMIGPILTPILEGLTTAFREAAPVVQQLVDALSATLKPILAELPNIIKPLVDIWVNFNTSLLPLFSQLIIGLTPILIRLSESFVKIMVALSPVLIQIGQMISELLPPLLRALMPIIDVVVRLAAVFANELALQINQIVMPALRMISQFLNGDLSGAMHSFGNVVSGIISAIIRQFIELPYEIINALSDLGPMMWRAGKSIMRDFADGIISGTGAALGAVNQVLARTRSYLPWSPAKVGPFSGKGWTLYSGQAISQGLADGISQRTDVVQAAASRLASAAMPGIAGVPTVTNAVAPGSTAGLSAVLPPPPTSSISAAAPAPVPVSAAGITIGTLTVNIPPGSLDMASPADRRRIVDSLIGDIKDGLRDYDRARGR